MREMPKNSRRGLVTVVLSTLPIALLLIQIWCVHRGLAERGRIRSFHVADTDSYTRLSKMSTAEGAVSKYRTYGYPLMIKTFGRSRLAGVELWIFFAGVVGFYAGVSAYCGSGWLALAAASPLLYGDTLRLFGRVQPDFVACGFALIAVASLLWLVVRPHNAALWLALVVSVFAAYQTRPAILFMIGWLPAIGWLLKALHERAASRIALSWAAGVAVAVILPFLLFAGWRRSMVGEFGLVAFGGYNMSGLAASFIDEELLEELDGGDRRMAARILRKRTRRGWLPYRAGEGSEEWFKQYSDNMWDLSVPAAKSQVARDRQETRARGDVPSPYLHVAVNSRLRGLSWEILRRRTGDHLSWIKDANLYGWKQLGGSPWVTWPAGLWVLSLVGARVSRRYGLLPPSSPATRSRLAGLVLLGVTFFLAYTFLVSLLSFPFTRYYHGTVLLLPSALCAALVGVWCPLRAPARGLPGRGPAAPIGGSGAC